VSRGVPFPYSWLGDIGLGAIMSPNPFATIQESVMAADDETAFPPGVPPFIIYPQVLHPDLVPGPINPPSPPNAWDDVPEEPPTNGNGNGGTTDNQPTHPIVLP
jgi:hypothetical protein